MDKNDRDSNPDLTKTKEDAEVEEAKVVEPPAKSSSGMPKFQVDPSVFDEVPGTHFPSMQAKKKRNPAAMWLILVLVLFLATGGYAAYQYMQAMGQSDTLAQKDSQIASLSAENAKLKSDAADAKATEPAEPESTVSEEVQLVASNYACATIIANTNTCDKATKKVAKIQEPKTNPATSGFAIVHVTDTNNKVVQKLLLKGTTATQWAVIYDGDTVPADTVKKFAVPTDFVNLTQ